MIVTCDGCQTKYLLGDEKVPDHGIRVRCPKCRYVWRLVLSVPESIFEVASGEYVSDAPVAPDAPRDGWASMEVPKTALMTERAVEEMSEEIEIPAKQPAPTEEKVTETPEIRRDKERARRLARVFVSDILEYNREKRDRGLASGDLMSVLGPEIKKAWEAYKEKVGCDLVECTDYFRDALNDILANKQKIF